MKSWKTRLLVVFTMVTMMLAGSAPATAQVWVPCLAVWQDPITWQWWCLTPSGWAPVPVAAQAPVAAAPAPVEERVVRVDEADLRDFRDLIEEIEEEEEEDEEDDDDNDDNDIDVFD